MVGFLVSSILILSFSSFNSKINATSNLSASPKKFTVTSPIKELKIYGEISDTNFEKGKEFTVYAHIKNLTDNKYLLTSDGNPVKFHFYKIGDQPIDMGTLETRLLDSNSTLDYQMTYRPEESGDYILLLTSYLGLSAPNKIYKPIKIPQLFDIKLLKEKIHVK